MEPVGRKSSTTRRHRMEVRRFKFTPPPETNNNNDKGKGVQEDSDVMNFDNFKESEVILGSVPVTGMASYLGRRENMEDALAIHPFLSENFHYFAVYDGHGCSHVAFKCRERFHQIVKEEFETQQWKLDNWGEIMARSFVRMDDEAIELNQFILETRNCRCGLKMKNHSDVGSTAVMAMVTPDKIVVANCGDSRAVLCRNGLPVPLSRDHKPDDPEERIRVEAAGGKVLFWHGARVSGVLAMSRAIGDGYLKPFVTAEPEISVTERTAEDEFVILASDGLWDMVSNEKACRVVQMFLQGKVAKTGSSSSSKKKVVKTKENKAASQLAKLALSRYSEDNVSIVVINLKP